MYASPQHKQNTILDQPKTQTNKFTVLQVNNIIWSIFLFSEFVINIGGLVLIFGRFQVWWCNLLKKSYFWIYSPNREFLSNFEFVKEYLVQIFACNFICFMVHIKIRHISCLKSYLNIKYIVPLVVWAFLKAETKWVLPLLSGTWWIWEQE